MCSAFGPQTFTSTWGSHLTPPNLAQTLMPYTEVCKKALLESGGYNDFITSSYSLAKRKFSGSIWVVTIKCLGNKLVDF
jgi:hypothetical protein